MNVLIIGSGAREHVLSEKISKSDLCSRVYIAPGNGGTEAHGQNVNIDPLDFEAVKQFCQDHQIGMLVPGNEDPLVAGIADYMSREMPELMVAGPGQQGAQLEGSKDVAKTFMHQYGIPTARSGTFTAATLTEGFDFLKELQPPYVIKADGLAAGKGVLIINDLQEAMDTLSDMVIHQKFGKASQKVVIEEYLHGIELSCFILTDGSHYVLLPEAKDYKRVGEGDEGLNTGGMGAVSPVPFADAAFMHKVEKRIIEPTIQGLQKEGIGYKGFLFIGLMNCNGNPYVIEYNVRMGDPETQVVMMRLHNDLLALLIAACRGTLKGLTLDISDQYACTVFTVSGGYPGDYAKGKTITLPEVTYPQVYYHAGTRKETDGRWLSSGGRVISATSMSPTLSESIRQAVELADKVEFDGKYFRRDIGKDLLKEPSC